VCKNVTFISQGAKIAWCQKMTSQGGLGRFRPPRAKTSFFRPISAKNTNFHFSGASGKPASHQGKWPEMAKKAHFSTFFGSLDLGQKQGGAQIAVPGLKKRGLGVEKRSQKWRKMSGFSGFFGAFFGRKSSHFSRFFPKIWGVFGG
jgi:hypothetical protein